MNNATHENAIHPVSAQQNDDDLYGQEEPTPEEQNEVIEILHQLDQLKYNPRAEAIRNILKYSGEKHSPSKNY